VYGDIKTSDPHFSEGGEAEVHRRGEKSSFSCQAVEKKKDMGLLRIDRGERILLILFLARQK